MANESQKKNTESHRCLKVGQQFKVVQRMTTGSQSEELVPAREGKAVVAAEAMRTLTGADTRLRQGEVKDSDSLDDFMVRVHRSVTNNEFSF